MISARRVSGTMDVLRVRMDTTALLVRQRVTKAAMVGDVTGTLDTVIAGLITMEKAVSTHVQITV